MRTSDVGRRTEDLALAESISDFCAAMLACATTPALVVEHELSDLAYVGHHVEAGAIVIDTNGPAKLRISFVSPGVGRVQVLPRGTPAVNKSPAVDGVHAAIAGTGVDESPDALVIRNHGISIRVDKRHLRVGAYDGHKPTSVEADDLGRRDRRGLARAYARRRRAHLRPWLGQREPRHARPSRHDARPVDRPADPFRQRHRRLSGSRSTSRPASTAAASDASSTVLIA